MELMKLCISINRIVFIYTLSILGKISNDQLNILPLLNIRLLFPMVYKLCYFFLYMTIRIS